MYDDKKGTFSAIEQITKGIYEKVVKIFVKTIESVALKEIKSSGKFHISFILLDRSFLYTTFKIFYIHIVIEQSAEMSVRVF